MSEVLDRMARSFSRRIALHRTILAHLNIRVPAERAAEVGTELRSTLMACNRCADPALCEGWAASGQEGLPAWCRAREDFDRLAAVTGGMPLPRCDA